MTMQAHRYHDFSYGHRVMGHENKCAHLHGHNGRIHFDCEGDQDAVGRIIDFSVIKERLCGWIEENWDHKFLANKEDIRLLYLEEEFKDSMVWVPFNPTAENMAKYMVTVIGPQQLRGTGVKLVSCTMEETRKCSATFSI